MVETMYGRQGSREVQTLKRGENTPRKPTSRFFPPLASLGVIR